MFARGGPREGGRPAGPGEAALAHHGGFAKRLNDFLV